MAELADARDLKSREIISRTGSIPASGTTSKISYRGVEQLVARRAHNPEVAGSIPVSATKNESSPLDCFFVFGTMCSASGT